MAGLVLLVMVQQGQRGPKWQAKGLFPFVNPYFGLVLP
jgi:hypothetical protein